MPHVKTNAVITHEYRQLIGALFPRAYFDLGRVATARVFDRIGDQVHEHLTQHGGSPRAVGSRLRFHTMFRARMSGCKVRIAPSTKDSRSTTVSRICALARLENASRSSMSRPFA